MSARVGALSAHPHRNRMSGRVRTAPHSDATRDKWTGRIGGRAAVPKNF